jgi:hypothetical protein
MVGCRRAVERARSREAVVPRMIVARGPRAVEARLLGELRQLTEESRVSPGELARPVRVVVPSISLRRHLCSRLVSEREAVVGIEVTTLFGLATGVLERAGETLPLGGTLLSLLVSRMAMRDEVLRTRLGSVRDGYGALVGVVRDLLDAGLTPGHLEALEERLEELPADEARERAVAVVRCASGVAEAMDAGGLGRPAEVLRRAAELLREDSEALLPSRAVLVHGFAEATGVASDLLEALGRYSAARFFLDEPPDPAVPELPDGGREFARRLMERLEGVAGQGIVAAVDVPAPLLSLVRAPGGDAEAREVANRVRALLDGGARPEGVGVVARQPEACAAAIERHFSRLAVPFSCTGVKGSWGPCAAALAALAALLRERDQASVDAWLASMVWPGEPDRADLRVGLRASGTARLLDVARLDPGDLLNQHDALPLPLRKGFVTVPSEEGDGEDTVLARRALPGSLLRAAVRRAASLRAAFARWRSEGTLGGHLAEVRAVTFGRLGWDREGGAGTLLAEALARLERDAPAGLRITREEALALVDESLAGITRVAPGGSGGGVQVLGVTEARAMTFDHLFLLGLNRDVFPRLLREDPILPDRIRAALLPVLPDLPVKLRGYVEERYLFAQLAAASSHVTLSWQVVDDDGRARPCSPYLERLRLGPSPREVELAPEVYALDREGSRRPRPAHEHAVMAGLFGGRAALGAVLPVAMLQAAGDAPALARARLRVLDELDPDLSTGEGRARERELGPYFGFIGPVGAAADPRAAVAVTTMEGVARCPWRVLLQRLLRLEPPPDPMASLPDVDAATLGLGVHAAMEAIVRDAGVAEGISVAEASSRLPIAVPWPEPRRLELVLADAALRTARDAGLALPGLRHVLLERLRPYLEVARALLWDDPPTATGVEVNGEAKVEGPTGDVYRASFRADLVEQTESGLRFTDYKSGGPLSAAKRPATRRRHLLKAVLRGERLQAAAYALSSASYAEARYASLRPPWVEDERETRLAGTDSGDEELLAAFRAAGEAVLAAWAAGAFFPRLTEPEGGEPRACESCEVREACLQGDSGARRRLLRWANASHDALSDPEHALLAVWDLRRKRGAEGE